MNWVSFWSSFVGACLGYGVAFTVIALIARHMR